MSEISDLIGIHGEIDRAIQRDPVLRDRVSRLLPVYRDPDVRWFDEFEAWAKELSEEGGDALEQPFPPFDEALGELAEIRPSGRMRARRLFAIAVAAQAFPELRDLESERAALAQRALGLETLTEGDEQAKRLLELLGDLPGIDDEAAGDDLDAWWQGLLESGLIVNPESIGPRSCSGRLVTVDLPAGRGPVATLKTEFETDEIDFDHATRFLEPANWPGCSAFWCEMTELGVRPTGVHRYHEVVSTDCPHKATAAFTVEAELDFRFRLIDNVVAITEYRLSEGHPQPGDRVLVDEGSLVVHQIGSGAAPRLRITTTKRIKFNHPFSGEALAMIMCALGYADVAADLVFGCALSGDEGSGTPFPAHQPTTAKTGARAKASRSDVGAVIKTASDETAMAIKECTDDYADAAQASYNKIAEGRYTADELVQDIANMWVRILRDGARAFDLGVRSARMGARTRARQRSAS